MIPRLVANWVYGGFLAAFVVLALLVLFRSDMSPPLFLIALQLPAYMFHQLEEHDNDRFRAFVNEHVGGGREVLSRAAVFIINIGGVWILFTAAIYLAAMVNAGFGLIAIHAVLINAVVHIVGAVAGRIYNPGLITSIVLFLPVGGYALWIVDSSGYGSSGFQALGLTVAVVLHLSIIGYVMVVKRRG